jgi:hypothetical protein
MADMQIHQHNAGSDPSGQKTIPTGTLKLVGNAVLELNIARKSMLLYPASHEQVHRSLALAGAAMAAALKERTPLVLTVLSDHLALEDRPLDPRSLVFKEFGHTLKLLGITSVVFQRLPENGQLANFVQLLTADPIKARESGGMAIEVASLAASGISIEIVDYSKLRTTQEKEIHSSTESDSTHLLWRRFVTHMRTACAPENSGGQSAVLDACLPSEMAALLNANQLDPSQALDYYQKMISGLMQDDQESAAVAVTDRHGLSDFHRLILELTPALQRQFLSVAFDQLARNGSTPEAEQLIDSMGGALIVRMLRQANDEGKEISPSLLGFISKMGWLSDGRLAGKTDAEALETLMAREAYETFVDSGYDDMLKTISQRRMDDIPTDGFSHLRAEIEESLAPARVNALVGKALMQLMSLSGDAAEYRDFGRQLALLLNDLISDGNFAMLIRIYDFVSLEQRALSQLEKNKVAGLVLNGLRDPKFVERVVALASRLKTEERASAFDFIARLGEAAVVEIFDNLRPEERLGEDDIWFAMLRINAPLAAREAAERLKDPRPDYVRLMLSVIRRLGDNRDAEGIKPLLDHVAPDIRLEALAVLLQFKNAWGVLRLRDWLNTPWSPETQRALDLAGAYRISEVLPILTGWLESKAPMRQDIDRREAALRTMGRIADPSSLEALTRLARRRSCINGKYLLRLKQTLFDSLDEFPYEQIKDLLHWGLRTRDAAVRESCRRLIQLDNPPSTTESQVT